VAKPWADLTEEGLHRTLAEFGIYPKLLHIDGKLVWGFERAQFEKAWKRYRIVGPKSQRGGK
jgi:hypothetical protein